MFDMIGLIKMKFNNKNVTFVNYITNTIERTHRTLHLCKIILQQLAAGLQAD